MCFDCIDASGVLLQGIKGGMSRDSGGILLRGVFAISNWHTRPPSSVMFAVGMLIAEHPPHRSGRARFEHPACMGLSLSRGRHANLVAFHSFVRPAPRAFFRPDRIFPSPSRRSGGQGRRFFSAAEGLSLTDASTAAGCRRSGGWPRDDPRGACHWPRSIARTTLVFG